MLSQADANLVKRQPMIPGLATLLDPDAFLSALQRSAKEVTILSGRSTYLRFKPGTNCLASYEVETSLGKVLAYGKAFALGADSKLLKRSHPSQPIGWLGFDGDLLLPEQVTLFSFPNDYHLHSLSHLVYRKQSNTLLSSASQELIASIAPNHPSLWSGQVEPLRYKPERRFVGCLSSSLGRDFGTESGTEGVQVLLKLYHEAESGNASTAAKRIRSLEGLHIAKRLGFSKHYNAIALEWLEGESLSTLWERETSVAANHIEVSSTIAQKVGVALAQLHAQAVDLPLIYDSGAEISALLTTAQSLAAIYPERVNEVDQIAKAIGKSLVDRPTNHTTIHGDFSADQVLLQPTGDIALLDLDCAGQGDPMADLGSFAAELYCRVACQTFDSTRATAWAEQVVDGYRSAAAHQFDEGRYQIHIAARLFRLAVSPFRNRVKDWDVDTDTILLRVKHILHVLALV